MDIPEPPFPPDTPIRDIDLGLPSAETLTRLYRAEHTLGTTTRDLRHLGNHQAAVIIDTGPGECPLWPTDDQLTEARGRIGHPVDTYQP